MVWQRFTQSWGFWSLINYLPAQNQTFQKTRRFFSPADFSSPSSQYCGYCDSCRSAGTCSSNFTLSLYDLHFEGHFEGCCSTKQSRDLTRAFRFLLFLTTILTSPGSTAPYIRGNSSGTFILESTAETRTFLSSAKHSSWLKHPMNYSHLPETTGTLRRGPNPTYRAASHQLHQCTCLGRHITRREDRRF